MNLLKIKPCDNTFFRDGKIFKMGYNNMITSKNTPYSSVFFGAVFSAFLAKNPKVRGKFLAQNFNNGDDRHKILNIGQVYLYSESDNAAYIPAPKDLFLNEKRKVFFGEFKSISKELHSLPYEYIMMAPAQEDVDRVCGDYINIKKIYQKYINKLTDKMNLVNEKDIFKKSYKVGIGTDYQNRIVKEDLLYRIEQTEFMLNKWSFIIEYEFNGEYIKSKYGVEMEELEQGYLKLGGENKACKFKRTDNREIEKYQDFIVKNRNSDSNIIKIIFTSDVYFKESRQWEDFLINNVIGMSNDKPIYIGGFDLNKGVKPMFKGYEAGTVFLVEKKHEDVYRIEEKLDGLIGNSKLEGFGQYFILEEKHGKK